MSLSWDVELESQFETTWINFRVVVLSHGDYLLYHILLRSSDKGIDVIHKLNNSLSASRGWWMNRLLKLVPFIRPVAYNAKMCPVPIEAISQDLPCTVDIGADYRCHVLTRALRNAKELPAGCDFITSYRRFAAIVEAPGTLRARDVLLIRLELDKLMLSAFVMLALVFSVVCGAAAGIVWKSLDTGLGVFGAVIGVVVRYCISRSSHSG
ncbi:hypothetical protein BBK36DRAFT_1167088 [Trichoderma citrinoviride]|uniref:Uncharacterized protein n=1 Tax=Trichoderma citrinoviride TaxID=58853 RepID=A0A2T4BIU6_9HYPO|nr:hypothetical protein BBK36DRAFT_1167088 [Trichoderma citrinoviride]PTB69230.1 hypothetical protein BBK36DRAFT_1167088 [Trichoderma citrinoviride]